MASSSRVAAFSRARSAASRCSQVAASTTGGSAWVVMVPHSQNSCAAVTCPWVDSARHRNSSVAARKTRYNPPAIPLVYITAGRRPHRPPSSTIQFNGGNMSLIHNLGRNRSRRAATAAVTVLMAAALGTGGAAASAATGAAAPQTHQIASSVLGSDYKVTLTAVRSTQDQYAAS